MIPVAGVSCGHSPSSYGSSSYSNQRSSTSYVCSKYVYYSHKARPLLLGTMLCPRPYGPSWSFLTIICLFSVQAYAVPWYNPTTDQSKIVCAYQLSGQYGLLPRLLFYVFIFFAAVGSSHIWLIAGALASALMYSGTAVVHAFILAIGSKPLYDLDLIGVWAILSVSCLAIQPMFEWSDVIPKVQSRIIFGFWGSLVAFGAMMSLIALLRNYPTEPECLSHKGDLLRDIWGIKDPAFNCSYACFDNKQILRSPTDIIILSKKRAFGTGYTLIQVTIGIATLMGIVFEIFAFLLVPQKKTELELRTAIATNQPGRNDIPKMRRAKAKARNHAKTELRTGKLPHQNTCFSFFNPVCLPVVIVLNEIYLLQDGGLPCTESLYSIGQWAPCVGVALALVAAVIVRWKQPAFFERQRILDHERAEFELRRRPRPAGETNQGQHGVPPTQDGNDLRPQQVLEMVIQNSRSEDFGTRIALDKPATTDLEAGLDHGSLFLLRKCPTL